MTIYTEAHAHQCRYPATYHGSLTAYHGDVFVTLDWEAIDRFGETRYVVYLPDGKHLRQAHAESVTIKSILRGA